MRTSSHTLHKIYLPEKTFTSSFYESYHYQSKKETFKPFIETIIMKRTSGIVLVNIPGYNSDARGYDDLYIHMAERAVQEHNCAAVLISNKYFKGYDNQKILLEKGRTIIRYILENSLSICGTDIPEIYLMGTSAGGSCSAAIAHEFPLIKKMLLINPSGDVPESAMRFAIEQFRGQIFVANGRCDYYIGPQTGKYLGSLAENSTYVKTFYLPNTSHSFKSKYSRHLIYQIPRLLFTNRITRYPPLNLNNMLHTVFQIPSIIRNNLYDTLVDTVLTAFSRLKKTIRALFTYVRITYILKKNHKGNNREELKLFSYVYSRLNGKQNYIQLSRRHATNYSSSVKISLFNSIINAKKIPDLSAYCAYCLEFSLNIFPAFHSVRIQSFISFVFEILSYNRFIPESFLKDLSNNNFLRVCRLCMDLESKTQVLFDTLISKFTLINQICLEDQRFWKIIHSLFFHNHSTDTLKSIIQLILHKNRFEINSDYFWLLLDIIIVHTPQPRSALKALYDMGRIYKNEINYPLLTAAHISSKNTGELIRLVKNAPGKHLFSILGNDDFLELLLMISKIKSPETRVFFYSLLSLYIEDIEEKTDIRLYLEKTKLTLTSIFAKLQSVQNNVHYSLLTGFVRNAPADQKHSVTFIHNTLFTIDRFIRETGIGEKECQTLITVFSYAKNDPAYVKNAFIYLSVYFELFSNPDLVLKTFDVLHTDLFGLLEKKSFRMLLDVLKNLSLEGETSISTLKNVFLLYPEIILRFFYYRIKSCNTAVVNRNLSVLDFESVSISENTMKWCTLLLKLPVSYENKCKLIDHILRSGRFFSLQVDMLRTSFDSLGMDERLRILGTYQGKYLFSANYITTFFIVLIESIIQNGSTSEHDKKIRAFISSYNLQYTESLIINKFLKRLRMDDTITKEYPNVFFELLKKYTEHFLRNESEICSFYFGPDQSRSINTFLDETKKSLHTSSGKPYFLPQMTDQFHYGLWRLVSEEALPNYILYGHEIKKSTSRYTYLGLTRDECFSMPNLKGFMVWIPVSTYNFFVKKKRIKVALREQSEFEVVIDSDIQSEDIRVYFMHTDLYDKHHALMRDFSILKLNGFRLEYTASISSEPVQFSTLFDKNLLYNVFSKHQRNKASRLAIIYSGKNNLSSLKSIFTKGVFKTVFPTLKMGEILISSLANYLKEYFESSQTNPFKEYLDNMCLRSDIVIQKRIRKGFNEGYIVKIYGKKFFAKTYENPDRLRCEFLSWLIYREGGRQVRKDLRLVRIDNKLYIAGEWINAPLFSGQTISNYEKAVDFVFSSIIQDRDQGKYDNYFYCNNALLPFDFGGSFVFRSTGGRKGDDGQLEYSLENLKEMLSLDSVHFRKELYNSLRAVPRIIEKAMLHLITELSHEVISALVDTLRFEEEGLAQRITTVLLQSRHYLMNRLAFFSVQKRRITEIPLAVDSIFDVLNLDTDPHIIQEELMRRFSLTGSIRYLLPSFDKLELLIKKDILQIKFPGYQSRIRASGRMNLMLENSEQNLSEKEIASLLLRLGAESYEIQIIQCLQRNMDFINTLISICEKPNASFFDKAESLQRFILDILQQDLDNTLLHLDIFTHDLLAVCLYILYVKNMDEQKGAKVLDRYRYYLSENLFDERLDY